MKLFADLDGNDPGSKALTLCPGVAYDRSPCGTGTSAKLAVLHGKGELGIGRWFLSESVLGTRFRAVGWKVAIALGWSICVGTRDGLRSPRVGCRSPG